jgi:hypothetical protein
MQFGEIVRSEGNRNLLESEEGSMVREGFRKLRDLLMLIWYFVRKQPTKPPAELEEKLSGIPETQAQRIIRRWQRSRARSIE